MKTLDNMPNDVMYVRMAAMTGIPIGFTFYEETLKKYPEWFPEETRRTNIWKSIPQKIKNKYDSAVSKMNKEVFGRAEHELCLGKGIVHRMNHPELYIDYYKEQGRLRSIYNIKEAKLYKKYFSKYGLKKLRR
jgi:hypothetical protein